MEGSELIEAGRLYGISCVQIKSEPIEYDVDVKLEPPDEGSDSNEYEETSLPNAEQEESLPEMESITVKIEPTYCSSEDEYTLASYQMSQETNLSSSHNLLRPILKIPRLKKFKKSRKYDSDEDYVPKRKKKKDKNEAVKMTYSTKAKKQENCYPASVTKHIELVTITEEERQIEFKELWESRIHMRYKCRDCAVGFVMEDPYVVHMKSHSPESGDYECEICRCRARSVEQLYKHRLRHYRRYRCSLCKRVHKDKETAASHIMSEHIHEVFQCDQCGKGFKRPAYLKKHISQQHTRGEQHDCPMCARVFFDRSMLRTHLRRHNEEVRNPVKRVFICDTCCRHFKNKQALKRHLLVHGVGPRIPCALCPAKFQTRRGLRLHEQNKHMPRERELQRCPHCERECTTPALLRQHIKRMHTDRTKKYQCDHCKRFYYTKGEVRAHIAWSHSNSRGERALFCCGREFRTNTRLKDHIAIHHLKVERQRIYKCDECEKAFANKQVLNRHKKSHANISYPCPVCDVRFKCQAYVKVHHQLRHLNMTRAQIKEQKQAKRKMLPGYETPKQDFKTQKSELVLPDHNTPEDLSMKKSEVKEMCFEEVIVKQEVDSDSEISIPLFHFEDLKPV